MVPNLYLVDELLPAPPRPDLAFGPNSGPRPSGAQAWASAQGTWAAASGRTPRGRRGVRLAVAVATAVAVLAGAVWFVLLRPAGSGGPAVALAMSFPKDRDERYLVSASMDGTMNAAGQQVQLSASAAGRLRMHVVSVDSHGVTTLRLSATHLRATANGKTVKNHGRHSLVRITSDGRVLSRDGLIPSDGSALGVLPGSGVVSPLPDHPVHVGDKWSNSMDVPIPIAGAKAHYTSTSRLVRYQTVDGVRSAVIESEGDVALDHIVSHLRDLMASTANSNQLPAGIDPTVQLDGSMHMYETTWLDTHHNLLVKSEGSGTITITMHMDGVPQAGAADIAMNGQVSLAMERLR